MSLPRSTPGVMAGAAAVNPQKWFRRHIIVDHFGKAIRIQVMHENNGDLKYTEFQQIKAGNWQQFLPMGMSSGDIEVRTNIRALVASGYSVAPMFFSGMESEDMAVLLLTDIHEPKLTHFTV